MNCFARSSAIILCAMSGLHGAFAQTSSASPDKPAVMLKSGTPASIAMVQHGIFEMSPGDTTDLTDERLFFVLQKIMHPEDKLSSLIIYTINGVGFNAKLGSRINLKESFKINRRECFIDVVDILSPDGGKSIAKFRMYCV